jgi:branched-chain amino acid transport system ATP-binding protein
VDPILELKHVSKSFGSVRVADDLNVRLEAGEALGVVGPNGAGKTTMMNLIVGTVPLDAGRVFFEGKDISGLPPHLRCKAGIGRTHQIPLPFEELTVFENVLIGVRFGRSGSISDPYGVALDLLKRTELGTKANAPAGSLTRALATGPRLLLLDEIGGGLTEPEVERLVQTIKDLRSEGITILWIEHIVHALISVVDRLLAIDFGRVLKEGPPEEVMASPEVQAVYMGVLDE